MLEKVKEFLNPYSDKVSEFIEPGVSWFKDFLQKDLSIIYAAIAIVLVIVIIAGLITCFRKMPKLFITILIILSIICLVWYFVVYK